jgi:hypothetical protein
MRVSPVYSRAEPVDLALQTLLVSPVGELLTRIVKVR